jgi:gliding motility-associated-like protein
MMKKIFSSIVFLFLITILSNASVFAKSSNNDYASISLATTPPTVTSPIYLCQNSSATPLTATPSGGGTLNWYSLAVGGAVLSGAPTPNTTAVGSTTYYVTQTIAGLESTPRTPIVVNVVGDNGATILGLTCDKSQIVAPSTQFDAVFFDWGNNPLTPGAIFNCMYTIQGGSPVFVQVPSSAGHLQVSNLLPGQSVTLTITSLVQYPCVPSKAITCTVPCITNTPPTFAPISNLCINDVPPVLPTTSTNGIAGTWSPLPVDTSTMGTKIYTFTPDPILFPCALLKTTLSISVEPIVPDFTDFSICSGDTPPNLNTTSPNGITGTWNPLTVDNMNSAPYVFTPNPGQPCTPTNKTINVTVNPSNTIANLNWTVTDAFTKNQIVTVTNPAGVNYVYQIDSSPFQASPSFENVASGLHSITVNDVSGCSALTDTNVLVIGYPKYFTPNGDTYNDIWNISTLSNQLNLRIYIFDRYGKLLKDISPNGSGWDGTYIGQPMPADDYWFTVEYSEQNVIKKFKSHFSLKR